MQSLQQCHCLVWPVLRQQHARQHQILGLPGVARLVVRTKATALAPAVGGGDVALGEQQPRPLRRDGVEQVGHVRTWRHPLGLADRLQGTRVVALGLPDPGQGGKTRGQRLDVVELPAPRNALGDVLHSGVQLAALVGDLGHAHLRDASGGRGRLAGFCGDLQRLLGRTRSSPARHRADAQGRRERTRSPRGRWSTGWRLDRPTARRARRQQPRRRARRQPAAARLRPRRLRPAP